MPRPALNEAATFYHKYINRVKSDDFLTQLSTSLPQTSKALEGLSEAQWTHRYAPGKWDLKEAWLHVIDAERVFLYRAMRIARGDETPMSGFDQDAYVPMSNAAARTGESIIKEYQAVRNATLATFAHFTEEMLERMGTASGAAISARALGFIIAGHELHHIALMNEKYLGN